MMFLSIVSLILSLALNSSAQNRSDYRPENSRIRSDNRGMVRSDNSSINERDLDYDELTADQQSNSARDIDVTRRIRQDIIQDSGFSTNARNVKIITVNGLVTLKGPVRSKLEQESIMKHALNTAGVFNVRNEMSVVSTK